MFSPVLSTFLLAFVTQVLANNNSPVAHSSSSYYNGTAYAAPAVSTSSAAHDYTVSGTYTASFAPPIYTCVVYVNATSTRGVHTSVSSGRPHYNISSTSYHPNATYVYTSVTSAVPTYTASFGSAPPAFNGSVSATSATPTSVRFSTTSHVAPSDSIYSPRPLTSTLYATLVTTDATVSTIYGTPTSVLIGYPTAGLPVCSPYGDDPQGTVSSTSTSTSEPSGNALQANSKTDGNTPSAGFAIKQNVAGITLGVVAGIALVML